MIEIRRETVPRSHNSTIDINTSDAITICKPYQCRIRQEQPTVADFPARSTAFMTVVETC